MPEEEEHFPAAAVPAAAGAVAWEAPTAPSPPLPSPRTPALAFRATDELLARCFRENLRFMSGKEEYDNALASALH